MWSLIGGKSCVAIIISVATVCILEVTHLLHDFEVDEQLVSGVDPGKFRIAMAYITLVALTSTVYGWFIFQTLSVSVLHIYPWSNAFPTNSTLVGNRRNFPSTTATRKRASLFCSTRI